MTQSLLAIEGLSVAYRGAGGKPEKTIVSGIDLTLAQGRTLGLIGASGSGKSTIANAVLGLVPAQSGAIVWRGAPLQPAMRSRAVSAVFQDPGGSLDPRRRLWASIAEPLEIRGASVGERRAAALAALGQVGLPANFADRHPHALSGGQKQRACIARALVSTPELIVLDEPTSALDTIAQAEVLDLLLALQAQRGLAYLLVSHDLGVIRHMCHAVAVLAEGRILACGEPGEVLDRSDHPFIRALVAAAAGETLV